MTAQDGQDGQPKGGHRRPPPQRSATVAIAHSSGGLLTHLPPNFSIILDQTAGGRVFYCRILLSLIF